MSQHYEIPFALFVLGAMQSLAWANVLDLMNAGLGVVLMASSIVYTIYKILLTRKQIKGDDE